MTPTEISRRKCRKCGKTAVVAFGLDKCPHCGAEYGRFEIGQDQEVVVPDKPTKKRRFE